jgi:hypothetical protein
MTIASFKASPAAIINLVVIYGDHCLSEMTDIIKILIIFRMRRKAKVNEKSLIFCA